MNHSLALKFIHNVVQPPPLSSSQTFSFFFFNIYLFFGCARFSFSMRTLSCGMQDLVPQPGIKPGPPALGVRSLTHWTTREVPPNIFITPKGSPILIRYLLSVSMDVPILDISYKWDQAVCGLWGLPSWHNVWEIHPCCSLCKYFLSKAE